MLFVDNNNYPVSAGRSGDVSYHNHQMEVQEQVSVLINTKHDTETYKHLKHACDYLKNTGHIALLHINPGNFVVKHGIVAFSSSGEYLARVPDIIDKVQRLYDDFKLIDMRT